jgi:enterochelin esterase-like enzyme
MRRYLLLVLILGVTTRAEADSPAARAATDRYRKENAPVWADGDQATFFYRGEADRVEVFFRGEIKALNRLPGSDVWTLTVNLPGLERGVFQYRLTPYRKGQAVEKTADKLRLWRGPKAPPPAERARLKGTLQVSEVQSQALGARRKVTVYLPPGHDRRKPAHVVYATDGESIGRFAHIVEPLITSNRVPPIVLIGVHSGGYLDGAPNFKDYDPKKDLRAQEYFPGLDARRFAAHESFFCKEVPAWTEGRFGVSSDRRHRAVFGYSNGGRFAVEMGLRHPDVFGHVFGFSVPGTGKFDLGIPSKDPPRYYLTAGTWEPPFHHCTASLAEQLKKRGVAVVFAERVAGHDLALWREEFAAAVLGAYETKHFR